METHKIDINGMVTTVETPDGFGDNMIAAFADIKGYKPKIIEIDPDTNEETEVDNPQTAVQFAASEILDYIFAVTGAYITKQAQIAAKNSTEAARAAMLAQVTIK